MLLTHHTLQHMMKFQHIRFLVYKRVRMDNTFSIFVSSIPSTRFTLLQTVQYAEEKKLFSIFDIQYHNRRQQLIKNGNTR